MRLLTAYSNIVSATLTPLEVEIITGLKRKYHNVPDSSKEWYQKPIGILVIAVAAIIIGALLIAFLKHQFPSLNISDTHHVTQEKSASLVR